MRLKKEVLRSRCKGPLHLAKFLNLSGLELVKLQRLEQCSALHWLIASNNKLEGDEGLENLQQLWYLDLSNNQICMLNSLSRYLALGTLILTNNNIKWTDLEKIRHANFLSISLHGNPALDSDPYYRIHVIDCLPLIWALDGRLVTVTEHLHVKQFFIDTELTPHPVRHKLGKTFKTSAVRNIGTEGVVSKQCKYIYSKFPLSETHTKHTDERRLLYLTRMVQENILQWSIVLERNNPSRPNVAGNFLTKLMEQRYKDVERCNMILLLLVISLEFQLPTALVKSVLNTAHLDMIGSVSTMPFFLLPRVHRTDVICVLLNAAKVDRDNNVSNAGGLYPQLFMCMYYTVDQLVRRSQTSDENIKRIKRTPRDSDYKALMASEVVSLMLQVPLYFHFLPEDTGVMNLTTCATGSVHILDAVQSKLLEAENIFSNISLKKAQKEGSAMILSAIQKRLDKINIRMSDIPIGDRYLALSDSLPIKPLHSVIWASEFLTKGESIPRLEPPILNPVREAAKPKPQQPKMGDKVLLGPQVVGDIAMLLEGEIAMVKIDAVPISNGAVESKLKDSAAHYTYVDLKALCYARDIGMWRPKETVGDKYTIQSTETPDPNQVEPQGRLSQTLSWRDGAMPLIYTPRTKTPMTYAPGATKSYQRPQSSIPTEEKMSEAMLRRAMSAGPYNMNAHNTNFSSSDQEFNDAFPLEEDEKGRDKSINNTRESLMIDNDTNVGRASKQAAILDSDKLHLHDHVHHIRGLTPREDSSRSVTLTLTPQNTERVLAPDIANPVSSRTNSPAPPVMVTAHEEPPHVEAAEAPGNETPMTSEDISVSERNDNQNAQTSETEIHSEQDTKDQLAITDSAHSQSNNQKNNAIKDSDSDSQRLSFSHDGQRDLSHLQNDNCPVCVANAENTFMTSVIGQEEGIEISQKFEGNEVPLQDPGVEDSQEIQVTEDENLDPLSQVNERPKTSRPTTRAKGQEAKTHFGGHSKMLPGRPQSAMDASRYYVITHPPTVVATGTSAKINRSFEVNGVFKTDFQQEREEAWKRTTRNRKPRPLTATVQRSSSQFPPPQQPTSPLASTSIRNPGLKITRTDRWLGGGRDLYWEDMRKRPKSGHTPGWKEGLPASMKKQRPKSAYFSSMTRSMSRPSSQAQLVSSCSSCRNLDATNPGQYLPHNPSDMQSYFLAQNYQLLHQQLQEGQQRYSSPVSDEDTDPLPLLAAEVEIS